jgi:hypothetical protein
MPLLSNTCSWNINHRCHIAYCLFGIYFSIIILHTREDMSYCEESLYSRTFNLNCDRDISPGSRPKCFSKSKSNINDTLTNMFYLLVFINACQYAVWSMCYESIDKIRFKNVKTQRDLQSIHSRYLVWRVAIIIVIEFVLSIVYLIMGFWFLNLGFDFFLLGTSPAKNDLDVNATDISRFFASERCISYPPLHTLGNPSICHFPINNSLFSYFKLIQSINMTFILLNVAYIIQWVLEVAPPTLHLEKYPNIKLTRSIYILFKLTGYDTDNADEYASIVDVLLGDDLVCDDVVCDDDEKKEEDDCAASDKPLINVSHAESIV